MKIQSILAIQLAAALAFAACGDDDNDEPTPGTGSGNDQGTTGSGSGAGGGMDGEPLGEANRPDLGTQVDRVGRPGISTALIATFEVDEDAREERKDAYNAAAPADWKTFEPDLQKSLAIIDGVGPTTDPPDDGCGSQFFIDVAKTDEARYAPLAAALADDQLYLDSTKAMCSEYLALERAVVYSSETITDCGGRTPNMDVIDVTYSELALQTPSGEVATGVTDGIDADDATHSLVNFPWLAAPSE